MPRTSSLPDLPGPLADLDPTTVLVLLGIALLALATAARRVGRLPASAQDRERSGLGLG